MSFARPGLRTGLLLVRWHLWLAFAVAAMLFFLRTPLAHADASTAHTVPVAVLAFDSDDAEEQADALTGALRSRIRASQGWSLVETSQSLGMLTAALRCPGKPVPAECEQRIGDQIRSERYIFGYVTKGPQASQVTAEIHLYQKSKPDTVIRESYAENLRDQNDDTLRKIAQRVLDRLGGSAVGAIVVKMGSESGEVIIDGDKRIPLQNGNARLELAPGGHSVEVSANGQVQKRNVLVTAGKETVVDLALAAPTAGSTPAPADRPFPVRKVVGGALMALGVVGGVVGILNFVSYNDDQDRGENLVEQSKTNPNVIRPLPAGQTADEACGKSLDDKDDICQANSDANRHSAIAIVAGGVGGALLLTGAYLLLFDPSSDSGKGRTGRAKKPILSPTFGHGGGALTLSGSF